MLGPRLGTLGNDDDRRVAPALVSTVQQFADVVDVERLFGDQDRRRAPGDAGVGGDPSGVAAHHLDDHHSVVALGRGVQAVDGISGDLHGGGEPERHVGADDVVVDRLGHADDRQPEIVVQFACDGQRAVAADHDQPIDPHVAKRRRDLLGPVGVVVRAAAAGAEQRAAPGKHAAQ